MQVEKTIKANVEVLTIKPTEIDTFWPLVEFLIAEASQVAFLQHVAVAKGACHSSEVLFELQVLFIGKHLFKVIQALAMQTALHAGRVF